MGWPGEQLVIRMWGTLIDNGIGSLLSPWHTKRMGRARTDVEVDSIKRLAQANYDARRIANGEASVDPQGNLLADSSTDRSPLAPPEPKLSLTIHDVASIGREDMNNSLARAQINLAQTVMRAEDRLLRGDLSATESSGNVDGDWLHQWKDYAGKVSAADLQQLWGNVLAGEVASPGKYSLRTLESLRMMSQADAQLIAKVAPFAGKGMIPLPVPVNLAQFGISYAECLQLEDIGILVGVTATGLKWSVHSSSAERFQGHLVMHDRVLVIRHEDKDKKLSFRIYSVTKVGQELLSLGEFKANQSFMVAVGNAFISMGWEVQLGGVRWVGSDRYEVIGMKDIKES